MSFRNRYFNNKFLRAAVDLCRRNNDSIIYGLAGIGFVAQRSGLAAAFLPESLNVISDNFPLELLIPTRELFRQVALRHAGRMREAVSSGVFGSYALLASAAMIVVFNKLPDVVHPVNIPLIQPEMTVPFALFAVAMMEMSRRRLGISFKEIQDLYEKRLFNAPKKTGWIKPGNG